MTNKNVAKDQESAHELTVENLKETLNVTKDIASTVAVSVLISSGIGLSGSASLAFILSVSMFLKITLSVFQRESADMRSEKEQ